MAGHVRRRGRQSFELKFDAGTDPLTGRRRIRYVSFKGSKREAEIELARLISENATSSGIEPSKSTFSEFLDRWDRDWATNNVEGQTIQRYRELIALYETALRRDPHPKIAARSPQRALRQAFARGWKRRKSSLAADSRPCASIDPSRARPCRRLGYSSSKRSVSRQSTESTRDRNSDLNRRSDRRCPAPSKWANSAPHCFVSDRDWLSPW